MASFQLFSQTMEARMDQEGTSNQMTDHITLFVILTVHFIYFTEN